MLFQFVDILIRICFNKPQHFFTLFMIYIKKLHNDVLIPFYATSGSAGMDICAYIEKPYILKRFHRVLIPTGFCLELPLGFEAQIRPRSGLALKYGVTVLNSPGTIDADYRGEVKAIIINLGEDDFIIEPFMRIAQMIITTVHQVEIKVVNQIDEQTQRGSDGFGSTGV